MTPAPQSVVRTILYVDAMFSWFSKHFNIYDVIFLEGRNGTFIKSVNRHFVWACRHADIHTERSVEDVRALCQVPGWRLQRQFKAILHAEEYHLDTARWKLGTKWRGRGWDLVQAF